MSYPYNISEILTRKSEGCDCNEDESAEIKRFLKTKWVSNGCVSWYGMDELLFHFNAECCEAEEEYINYPDFHFEYK